MLICPSQAGRADDISGAFGNRDLHQRTGICSVTRIRRRRPANRRLVGPAGEVVVAGIPARERSRRIAIENEARTSGHTVEVDDTSARSAGASRKLNGPSGNAVLPESSLRIQRNWSGVVVDRHRGQESSLRTDLVHDRPRRPTLASPGLARSSEYRFR